MAEPFAVKIKNTCTLQIQKVNLCSHRTWNHHRYHLTCAGYRVLLRGRGSSCNQKSIARLGVLVLNIFKEQIATQNISCFLTSEQFTELYLQGLKLTIGVVAFLYLGRKRERLKTKTLKGGQLGCCCKPLNRRPSLTMTCACTI